MRYTPGPDRLRKRAARTPPIPADEAQRLIDSLEDDPTFEPVGRGLRCSFDVGDRLPAGADRAFMQGFRPNYRKPLDARFDLGAQWPDPPTDEPVRGVDAALDAFDRFADAGLRTWLSFHIVLQDARTSTSSEFEYDLAVIAGSDRRGPPEAPRGWASLLFGPTVTRIGGWSEVEQMTLQALGVPRSLLASEDASSEEVTMTVCPPVDEGNEPLARRVEVSGPAGWVRASNVRVLLGELGGWVQGGRVTAEGPVRHRDVVAAELVPGRLGDVATGGWVGFYAYGLREVTAAGALAESQEAYYRFGSVGVRGHRVALDLIVARGDDGEPIYRLSADPGADGPDAVVVLTEDWGAAGPVERW